MRIRRICTVLAVVAFSPALTGCWGYKEFEHQYYPHAIALDKQSDGEYVAYVQVLNMTKLGKSEGKPESNDSGSWVGTAKGKTVDEVAHNLYQVTPRTMNWGHVTSIVLSENLLRDSNWINVFGIFTRFNQFRYTSWIFVTPDDVSKILTSAPIMEESPVYSGLGDPFELYRESSFIRPIRMNELIANLQEPAAAHRLPLLSLVTGSWFDAERGHPVLTLSGYSVLNDKLRFVDDISVSAARGLRWVDPKLRRTSLNVEKRGHILGSAVLTHTHPRIRYVATSQDVKYDINIAVKGIVTEKYGDESLSYFDHVAESEIKHEVYQTYRIGLDHGADLFGLEEAVYRKNPTLYHRLISEHVPLTVDSLAHVNVRVKLLTGQRTLEGPKQFTH